MRAYLMLTALFTLLASAAVIDRVAVTVGLEAITETEVDREIRLTALLNGEQPDLSAASRRKAAERLVEQTLIRREMELSRYPAPDTKDIDQALEKIKKQRFGGEAELQAALARLNLTEEDVKRHLLWQTTLLRFIEMRFRPGVQVSEQDIREYFEKEIRPAANNGQVSLDDFRDRIEQAISGQRADQEMDAWMKEVRARTKIVYHPEVFEK